MSFGSFPVKRKYRWTFEAFAVDGTVTFPQSFVKVSNRPAFPYMMIGDENGGHEEYLPGDLRITQFFTFYDGEGEAFEAFNEFLSKTAFDATSTGVLRLYDGCGTLVEEWQMEGVTIKFLSHDFLDYSSDEIIADWEIKYQKSEWVNHAESIR